MPHDRALAAGLAQRLAAKVGPERVFLPFCDTDEEDLVAEVKGRRLFELDRDRLGRLDAMVAVLHGPSLDDGVCMEIGYAAAAGIPVIVLTTDFQTYSLTESGPGLEFPDPLLQAVATRIVRVARLGAPALPSAPVHSRFTGFRSRNAPRPVQPSTQPSKRCSTCRIEFPSSGAACGHRCTGLCRGVAVQGMGPRSSGESLRGCRPHSGRATTVRGCGPGSGGPG
ncbi:nucleoside 2-deoxyribosyltransferase [Streptomyces sp. NPDC102274]|uniref:nucleoside 2-deoxyribosyltransferase n=1 Tax=Streptomyces sp. NPDC102274 TaxID=3366151 RepID=UPI00381F1ADA